jgi:hypothetical protein
MGTFNIDTRHIVVHTNWGTVPHWNVTLLAHLVNFTIQRVSVVVNHKAYHEILSHKSNTTTVLVTYEERIKMDRNNKPCHRHHQENDVLYVPRGKFLSGILAKSHVQMDSLP